MNLNGVVRTLCVAAALWMLLGCGDDGGGSPSPLSGDLQPGFGDAGSGVIRINPDPGPYDWYRDGAVDAVNGFLYVVGGAGDGASTNFAWRIEKRRLSDGGLVTAFMAGGVLTVDPNSGVNNLEEARAIALDVPNNVMYLLGTEYDAVTSTDWRVEKRFLDTGLPDLSFGTGGTGYERIVPSSGDDLPAAIAIDGTMMYLVGYDEQLGAVDRQWRYERRLLSDGSPDPGFGTFAPGVEVSNPSSGADEPEDMAIDGTYMYVVGNSTTGGPDVQWHIEKRSLDSGALDTGFDGDGLLSLNHAVGLAADDELRSIAIDATAMFLGGDDSSNGGYDRQWRVEKRLLSDGTLVTAFDGDGVLLVDPDLSFDFCLGVYLDGSALYVSGVHHIDPPLPNQDLQIEILKRDAASGGAITTFGSSGRAFGNPTALVDGLAVFGTDATHLYLGGIENLDLINDPPESDQGWRIEKRLK